MSKQPFLPLFFGDFLASTACWSGEERALYLLLLGYQWASGPLPEDVKRLALACQYEPKAFAKLWKVVGPKFQPVEGGLANLRLEEHREKAKQLSEVRASVGRKGAEAKALAKGNASTRANEQANEQANGKQLPEVCSTIQSNPIQNPDLPSPQDPHVSAHSARARAREKPAKIPETLASHRFAAFREAYPDGTFNGSDWIVAERNYHRLIDSGATEDELIDAAERYAKQQQAKGSINSQFIRAPSKFLADDFWRDPFPIPAAQPAANGQNVAAIIAWNALLSSDGEKRDDKVQRALDAIGGWQRVKLRTERDADHIRKAFCTAYAEGMS